MKSTVGHALAWVAWLACLGIVLFILRKNARRAHRRRLERALREIFGEEEGYDLALDIKNLKGESTTATIAVGGGSFDVEFHAHATTSDWQSEIGALQREYQEAKQDVLRASSEKEIEEAETEKAAIATDLTAKLQEVIVGWDLQEDGEDIPVSTEGLDRLSMALQQAIFEKILTEGSGGDEGAKKRRSRRSRRGSS